MRAFGLGVAVFLLGLSGAGTASAVTQPGGVPIPALPGCDGGKTTGLSAMFSCVCKEPGICNQGAPCPGGSSSCDPGQNGTCETTLWHEVNDDPCIPKNSSGLDPWNEAFVVPEVFHPTCPQTFTVITRGTALFQNAFGWYNATGAKPAASELHVMLDCSAKPGDSAVLDLSQEAAYTGGDIGFFLVTPEKSDGQSGGTGSCDDLGCCATLAGATAGKGFVYYSERKFNPDYSGKDSWVHLLTYQSHIFDDTFYFAWEDSNKSPNNDFTDLVTSVSGIRCAGAGVTCDTGKPGVCGAGIRVCQSGATICDPVFPAGAEVCNGLDDDCNGAVDDGASCDDPAKICDQGRCVGKCGSQEFPCPAHTECNAKTGLCVAAACADKTCPEGEICRDGECTTPCAGVVCPHGQSCVGDKCLDLCQDVSCAAGEVCAQGKCFPSCTTCDGLSCAAPLSCDQSSGQCADPSCAGGCPAGTYCSAGSCKDACDGDQCPSGQSCVDGNCCAPGSCGIIDADGGAGDAGADDAGVGGASASPATDDSGCGCRAQSSHSAAGATLLLFGLLFGGFLRRRR